MDQIRWRSKDRFLKAATDQGFSINEAQDYFQNSIQHDKKINKNKQKEDFIPIFSHKSDTYQFDTLIQAKGPPYLIFINVNSRKGYAYPMENKGASEVLKAITKFVNNVKNVSELTSDEDAAYLSGPVQKYFLEHNIQHYTTEENNHNILGIINRFIKTLRDLNYERDFTPESMENCIATYNNSKHSSIKVKPNDFSHEDEVKYVGKKQEEVDRKLIDDPQFQPGKTVRVLDESKFQKKRLNYKRDLYRIDSRDGYNYIIGAKDHSVLRFPKHKLIPDTKGKLAETIANGKKGVVESILGYNPIKDTYHVKFDGGSTDVIPSKNMREGNPTRLSPMEKQYWGKNKLPSKLSLFLK
ncbi:MAG: hypothetical protein LBM99_06280 [Bacillales bacterium]|jgi:hypothetical protein|nr:hypothetical protein [Bacillales bacterium]